MRRVKEESKPEWPNYSSYFLFIKEHRDLEARIAQIIKSTESESPKAVTPPKPKLPDPPVVTDEDEIDQEEEEEEEDIQSEEDPIMDDDELHSLLGV